MLRVRHRCVAHLLALFYNNGAWVVAVQHQLGQHRRPLRRQGTHGWRYRGNGDT